MPLRTRPIKGKKKESDGVRISVMSRHTLADGRTLDHDITSDSFEEWWHELGPPPKLIGALCRGEITWDAFEKRFCEYLELPRPHALLEELIERARAANITIMCVESTPECCHRRLIAERCKELDPLLEVHIE